MMAAPRINALQKLWLREIGIEKTWLQTAEPEPPQRAASPVEVTGLAAPGLTSVSALIVSGLKPIASEISPVRSPIVLSDQLTPVVVPKQRAVITPLTRVVDKAPAAMLTRSPQGDVVVPAGDFDALSEQVQSCTACGLCHGRRHAVFGMGARPARWMIIGEAPGEQEDRQGLPFVGRSGDLLNAMLSASGLSREKDVFISNVIKCRPPGNRNPKVEEVAACSPYLMRQIELVQPERILVLGRFAAQTLLKTDATIGSLRGRLHDWTSESGQSISVVVSYHPAYLLRSPVEKARAWQDLQLALA